MHYFLLILNLIVLSNSMPTDYIDYCTESNECSVIKNLIIPFRSEECNKKSFLDHILKDKINYSITDFDIYSSMKVKNCSKIWIRSNGSYKIFNNLIDSNSGQSNNILFHLFMLQLFLFVVNRYINN